jgi:NAD+ synthase
LEYSTRWGDSVGDFAPLANLTVSEVKAIGYELGLPTEFIEKVPSDGLCGKTDEDNLGFTYEALDRYIRLHECDDPVIKEKIDKLNRKNQFKLDPIPSFQYNPGAKDSR